MYHYAAPKSSDKHAMNKHRRKFLHGAAALLSLLAAAPARLFANWPKELFTTTDFDRALALLAEGEWQDSDAILLKVPGIAEDGGAVRVEVEARLDGVESISLLVEKNPVPLTSQFVMHGHSRPYVATNLKVRETSDVVALVKAGGRWYGRRETVRVTAGGCG